MNYEIEKTEKNIDIEATNQDGKTITVKGTRYIIKIEGTERRLIIEGVGKIPKEQIEETMRQALSDEEILKKQNEKEI